MERRIQAAIKIQRAWSNFTNKYSRCIECLIVRLRTDMDNGNLCIYCLEDCQDHDIDPYELPCGCIDICRGRCGINPYTSWIVGNNKWTKTGY